MRLAHLILAAACAGVLSATLPAEAAIRPSFSLNQSLEHATDIVEVDEGEVIDGRVTVRRVWRGGLDQGEHLDLPDLAIMADPEERTPQAWWDLVKHPPLEGKRLIVFLTRDPGQPEPWNASYYPASAGQRYATVWLEGSKAYAVQQIMNPGPSLLSNSLDSPQAARLEAKIAAHQVIHEARREALAEGDAVAMYDIAKSFASMGFNVSAVTTVQGLSTMGEGGAEQLRRMLKDPTSRNWHEKALRLLVEAQVPGVADDLLAAVERGETYFRETLPRLESGWWNNSEDSHLPTHLHEYSRMLTALRLLKDIEDPRKPAAAQLVHELWRFHAQRLTGLEQVSEACVDLGADPSYKPIELR